MCCIGLVLKYYVFVCVFEYVLCEWSSTWSKRFGPAFECGKRRRMADGLWGALVGGLDDLVCCGWCSDGDGDGSA